MLSPFLNYDMIRSILYNLSINGILSMSSVNHRCYNMVFEDHTTEIFIGEITIKHLKMFHSNILNERLHSLCLKFDVNSNLKILYCSKSLPTFNSISHFKNSIVNNNFLDLYAHLDDYFYPGNNEYNWNHIYAGLMFKGRGNFIEYHLDKGRYDEYMYSCVYNDSDLLKKMILLKPMEEYYQFGDAVEKCLGGKNMDVLRYLLEILPDIYYSDLMELKCWWVPDTTFEMRIKELFDPVE